jgi:glycosyl transferase family 2
MKVVRMLAVRDEVDILEANLGWYAEAGIETVAVDNGSSDGSAEILRDAVRAGLVSSAETVEPQGPHSDWRGSAELLERLQTMAAHERPDVLLLASADEFFEVGDGSGLVTALEEDVQAGSTVFEFKNMEFHMTDRDPDEEDILLRLRHYSHWDVGMYRGVRWVPGVDFATRLGHRPVLPRREDWRLSPRLYVSRHYPLRSPEQAARKIARLKQRADRPAASTHYLRLVYGNPDPRVPRRFLTRYEFDNHWNLDETLLRWRLRQTARALSNAHLRIEQLESGDA